jgi:thioredoxin 1
MMRLVGNIAGMKRVVPSFTKRCFSNFIVPGDTAAFETLRAANSKKVLYFTASWCPPCKVIGPVVEKLAKQSPDITFVKIDIDDLPEAAQYGQIQSVPTFQFRIGQAKMYEFSGADEGRLAMAIEELENAD